ncbi:hypothetical protein MUO14_23830 [Halobacillus shinanisalinarum]|uniref:Uncharacterized protein n=1 Tax=Halobacillus shinanisalinarum TaxID=2932258 RepID=A0ABY4GZM4_9BACI|nr:hypothetical protein [Halobacillus shinanisalinarum]UOQ93363.1 hypothetical protein MUO14_23830 [Halobacillus shinanisalinarum]
MNKLHTLQMIHQEKLIAVIRGDTQEEAEMITEGSYSGGITIMELTYTVPGAT